MRMNRKSIAIGLVVGVLAAAQAGAIAANKLKRAIGHWQTHARDWDGRWSGTSPRPAHRG